MTHRHPMTSLTTDAPDAWVEALGFSKLSLFVGVGLLLGISFVVANLIAFCMQLRQQRRIRQKTIRLAKADLEQRQEQQQQQFKPVPVTILTGFLGAGKTTLLNRILQTPSLPYKIMVLENEIGAISIDHTLLKPGLASDALARDGIYVLQNGCMCCTARGGKGAGGELERILDYLLRIVNEEGFDYLLVETTGLADPGPIIETFLQLRASRFRLDAVVTMVDSHATRSLYDSRAQAFTFPVELQRQLLYADVVALNKIDLLDEPDLVRLENAIRTTYSPGATMLRCAHAQLDLSQIIGINTFDAVRFYKATEADGDVVTSRGGHTQGIETMHLDVEAEVDVAKFSDWLNAITAEYARSHILRIKGILAISGSSQRCILQCVLDTYTIAPSTPWLATESRRCRLVIIGKQLKKGAIEAGFLECIAMTSSSPDEKKCL